MCGTGEIAYVRYRIERRVLQGSPSHRAFLTSLQAMAVVIATNLRKDIAGTTLFEGVSFKLERRDRVALAGPNGAGKTTLLRCLTGETELHGGELVLEKSARVALHDQRPPRRRSLTLRDYVL